MRVEAETAYDSLVRMIMSCAGVYAFRRPARTSTPVEAYAELVVDGVHVRLAAGEEARLAQEHGQAASLEAQAVGGVREDGGRLRVEPLLEAVADGALSRGREAGRAPRV